MGSDAEPTTTKTIPERVLSIDALRGFDMLWIVGGAAVLKALAQWANWPIKDQIDEQLEHVPWAGFHCYDLIFPLFLFVVGAVLPFSLGKLRERGEPTAALYRRIFRRTVLLFVLGLIYNHFLQFDFANLRLAGVLQRIALCYCIAALIVVHMRIPVQALITAVLLLGYWALLAYVPAPGRQPGDYSKEGNLSGYVDRHWLPGKIYKEYYEFGDNEGILSTIPAVGTALLGVLAGQLVRSSLAGWWKVLLLTAAGILSLIAGDFWSHSLPIIKNIWTSSFVLYAGGWSLLLLALFYLLIDVFRFWRWAFFFIVIGSNAILIYILPHIIDFHKVAHFFLGGVMKYSGSSQAVLEAIGVLAAEWLLLLFLYKQKIFLRV